MRPQGCRCRKEERKRGVYIYLDLLFILFYLKSSVHNTTLEYSSAQCARTAVIYTYPVPAALSSRTITVLHFWMGNRERRKGIRGKEGREGVEEMKQLWKKCLQAERQPNTCNARSTSSLFKQPAASARVAHRTGAQSQVPCSSFSHFPRSKVLMGMPLQLLLNRHF